MTSENLFVLVGDSKVPEGSPYLSSYQGLTDTQLYESLPVSPRLWDYKSAAGDANDGKEAPHDGKQPKVFQAFGERLTRSFDWGIVRLFGCYVILHLL